MKATTLTRDIPDRFFSDLKKGCATRKIDALSLLSVMFSESGLYAHARNPKGGATGILQFMPPILVGLGWTNGAEAFKHLDAAKQLPYVFAYFSPWMKAAGGELKSIGRIYQATFLPATLSKGGDPDFVLAARKGPLGWAYDANAGFDVNGDKAITIGELEAAVCRNCRGPRWAEVLARFNGADEAAASPLDTNDLSSVAGVQAALLKLGFDPKGVDGALGEKTRAALVAFQIAKSIPVTGTIDSNTRAALEAGLKAPVASEATPELAPNDEG